MILGFGVDFFVYAEVLATKGALYVVSPGRMKPRVDQTGHG